MSMPGTERRADPARPQRGRNRQLVLDALRGAGRPLGAYELLRLLRSEGLRSPLQVYRALDRLIEEGSVHKIESVSAYAVCTDAECGSGGPVVFAICTRCGQAAEARDPGLGQLLGRLARRQGFRLEASTVELSGLCEACAQG
jgi:Fur family zinc uptake transcriptional regulator